MVAHRHAICCALTFLMFSAAVPAADETATEQPRPISYYKQIRPIFQAHCQGCHQPAKSSGAYVMTTFEQLVGGGESEEAAIVPGKPDESYLVEEITPVDGEAAMPKGKPPLADAEIALIREWITQGAVDDTPANARQKYDAENPPVYSQLPVVTSIDYSTDGTLIAVAGFHEVLLHNADGSGLAARLVGMSERIEAVRFSRDGSRLAVAGGKPGRMGEIQIWDVAARELTLSIPLTYDTLYGISWSPDGSLVAVGCSDNAVRAFKSDSGEQVFFNGAHDDWALSTVFSADGSHIVSVGRDMSTKLYEVATQRFVDNVTSITPGALKGGLAAVTRHPQRDEILVGGSDGVPRIYRMQRITKRVIGDDANLIRRYPAMRGRIYAIDYAPDGKTIVAGSSLDGQGQVFTFAADFDPAMPDDIKAIVQKVVTQQSAEEKKKLEEYVTSGAKTLTETEIPGGVYAVSFSPDGNTIAVAGADGRLRLLDAKTGEIRQEIATVETSDAAEQAAEELAAEYASEHEGEDEVYVGKESLPEGAKLTGIEVTPSVIELHGENAYTQILATGILESGDRIDVTRIAELTVNGDAATVTRLGRVVAKDQGQAELVVTLSGQTVNVPVHATTAAAGATSFVRDVNPVLSRLGCNQGTCHGAKDGKNGFKLSLRGYDPIFDVRAFTDDLKSRRVNIASPDNSLMLLKATGAVPHVGGQLTQPGHPYYEVIRHWIGEGGHLDLDVPRVASITVEPENPVVQMLGARQQVRVVATYTDGSVRDVTGEAFVTSGDTEIAEVNRHGVLTALRRGEAPILARFEGQYAATTLTAMGDRSGFEWEEPETWTEIDRLVAEKWERMKIRPSELCTDAEFIRRVYLDLTGLPPTAEQVRDFLDDKRPTREKREALIDALIGSDDYVEYWTNKWADLLQVNRKFLGPEGARLYRDWIRQHVASNTPYDEFCYQVLAAEGSNKENPAASYYKILREPDAIMENTTHLFLGVRFNCNKCHDHPFERWTQDQYYETTAFFSQVGLKRDPNNKDGNIGGTAVEGAKPLWEVVYDKDAGEITHDRTGEVTAPLFPYDREIDIEGETSRREKLARWITSPENDYFARSYVNRVWGYLMGVGLIEPLDDIRAGNPPTNPELLDMLTEQFIASGFDVRELMRSICRSRVYHLSVATNEWNAEDTTNYSHALPKRLPAEVLYDAIYTVTGAPMQIPGVPAGTRAAALPDVGVKLQDGFLANLGRPVRESACECERSSDLQLGPVMALMNGPTVGNAISDSQNEIAKLVAEQADDAQVVNQLFLRILNRPARPEEIEATLDVLAELGDEHSAVVAEYEAYQREIAPVIATKEQKREQRIATAEQALKAYEEEIRPREEQAEKERQEQIAAAQKALDDYLAALPAKLAEWEKTAIESQTAWVALEPSTLNSTTGAKFETQDDLSIFVTGPNNKKGAYRVAAATDLSGITGLKLELFADDRLPSRGPGRAQNGNFVLTELTVQAWPKGKPDAKATLGLQNAQADFSQGNYDVSAAIDGKKPANNGWATSPRVGENRVATFEFKEPVGGEEGTILHFTLDQNYSDRKHTIGRFRLSVTTSPAPLQFGLPKNILQIVQTPAEERSEEQQKELLDYYRQMDAEVQKLEKALAEAKKPRPEDPKLVALRATLEDVRKPLPEDPKLARLRRAVELSQQQLDNGRLTVAQDLAWALINSPAFLFNR
ncbi:WD domain, G-beta repeat [Maioricimonas rarisocia]|uniref:WD domain, G-beta repeat n=1 Tax=Maioricimonas rarisocia TaxID=2528026 RepID=A0A517ZEY4_9PLAN|nr:DUF1549 domain-containing protein [Maioricimonas rarisocia]QDU41063.1 WD domain, G-beta repeat [Maioricimonas rarisocia]